MMLPSSSPRRHEDAEKLEYLETRLEKEVGEKKAFKSVLERLAQTISGECVSVVHQMTNTMIQLEEVRTQVQDIKLQLQLGTQSSIPSTAWSSSLSQARQTLQEAFVKEQESEGLLVDLELRLDALIEQKVSVQTPVVNKTQEWSSQQGQYGERQTAFQKFQETSKLEHGFNFSLLRGRLNDIKRKII
jgi:hypothetical protein